MLALFNELFANAPLIAWAMVSVFAVVLVVSIWKQVNWWCMNVLMNLPVIGRIARYSRDTSRARRHEGWLRSELILCMDYKRFLRDISEHDYNEKVEYLALAGDNGRRPMPSWVWPVVTAMLLVQAIGFSNLLVGFSIPGIHEHFQPKQAYVIALLISGLLVFLAHSAGHELYRNGSINQARREWEESGRKYDLRSGTVALSKPQNIDADYPEYTRRINRIGASSASYKVSISVVIVVAIVAIGSTYVHGQALQKVLTKQTTSQIQQTETPAAAIDGLGLSADVRQSVSKASARPAHINTVDAIASNSRIDGWGNFIVMAFIFAALQALCVYFGFRWGFAGQNSAQAFRATGSGKFASYEALLNYNSYICEIAQIKLETLQQRLMEQLSKQGAANVSLSSNTFLGFIKEQHEVQSRERERQRARARARIEEEANAAKAALVSKPAPAATHAADLHDETNTELAQLTEPEVRPDSKPITEPLPKDTAPKMKQPPRVLEMALHQVNSLKSMENKMAFIKTLPAELQSEVLAALNLPNENQ